MRVVVQHLYTDNDVFVRELRALCSTCWCSSANSLLSAVSNSNDALEKTRLLSLTDSSLLATAPILNVTVLADIPSGRIVIRGACQFHQLMRRGTEPGAQILASE